MNCKTRIKIGKRYRFALTSPEDGRYKSGLVSEINNDIAILKTKGGQEWAIPLKDLKPINPSKI